MSTTDLTVPASAVERPLAPERRPRVGVPWSRVALACAILVVAGVSRLWQEHRVKAIIEGGRVSPFPLKSLPMTLGTWQVAGDREEKLDPEIIQALKCDDYIKRHYVNENTGVGVDVLVLYGPSTIAHLPEICFPGAGFEKVDGPRVRIFPVAGGQASFNSLIFAKGEGGATVKEQVLYALRYGGQWTSALNYKVVNRLPGLYKVQLTRRMGDRERLDQSGPNPCEALLNALLPDLEHKIAESLAASQAEASGLHRKAAQ
jgi:Protein of unknown function (DUF3485)